KVKDRASFVSFARHPVTILKAQNASRLLMPALVHSVKDRLVEDQDRYGMASSATINGGGQPSSLRDLADKHLLADDDEQEDFGGGLALALTSASQRERALMLLVSDFVNMNDDDWEALRINCMKNEVIVVFVQDRRERELPRVPFPGMSYTLEDLR